MPFWVIAKFHFDLSWTNNHTIDYKYVNAQRVEDPLRVSVVSIGNNTIFSDLGSFPSTAQLCQRVLQSLCLTHLTISCGSPFHQKLSFVEAEHRALQVPSDRTKKFSSLFSSYTRRKGDNSSPAGEPLQNKGVAVNHPLSKCILINRASHLASSQVD